MWISLLCVGVEEWECGSAVGRVSMEMYVCLDQPVDFIVPRLHVCLNQK